MMFVTPPPSASGYHSSPPQAAGYSGSSNNVLFKSRVVLLAVLLLLAFAPVMQATESDESDTPFKAVVSGLKAYNREGQTFLTWDQAPEAQAYRLYCSSKPINSENAAKAKVLVPNIPKNSSQTNLTGWPLDTFTLSDMGEPLVVNKGLCVVKAEREAKVYYAVTCLNVAGEEYRSFKLRRNSLSSPVREKTGPGKPVLQRLADAGGKGEQEFSYVLWLGQAAPLQPMFFRIMLGPNFSGVLEHPLMVFCGSTSADLHYPPQSVYVYLDQMGQADEVKDAVLPWLANEYHADKEKVFVFGAQGGAGSALSLASAKKKLFFTAGVINDPLFSESDLALLRDGQTALPPLYFFLDPPEQVKKSLEQGKRHYEVFVEADKNKVFEAKPAGNP